MIDGVSFGLGVAWQEVLDERAKGFVELASGFGGDGIEDNGRFAGTGYTGEDGDLALGDAQRDIFQVVFTSAANLNIFLRHRLLLLPLDWYSNANPDPSMCWGLGFTHRKFKPIRNLGRLIGTLTLSIKNPQVI